MEVAKWAEEMDILGKSAMRNGTVFTKFGNPIDESCYKGLSKEEWEKRLARMEAGIAHAVTQAQRCWSTLGFGSTTGIIPTLRRTKFNCSSNTKVAASASFSGVNAPTYDHSYELNDWGPYMDKAPMDWVGSTLFHETLHWSVENNRSYHNHTHTRNRSGCDKSLYEDRVYLLEASCFPNSDVGQEFYDDKKGAVNCPGVCEKAMTESDTNTLPWFQRAFQGGSENLHGGKYKPKEAEIICNRVRNVQKNYKQSREDEKILKSRTKSLLEWGKNNFGDDTQGRDLQVFAKEAFDVADNAYDPDSNLNGIKKVFAERKKKFVEEVRKTCEKPLSMTLMSFCKFYTPEKNPVIDEMKRIEEQFKQIKVSDFALFTSPKYVPRVELKPGKK